VPLSAGGPGPGDLDQVHAIFLPGGSRASVESWQAGAFDAIGRAVRGGKGLLAAGRAAAAAPGLESFSDLLSRRIPAERPAASGDGLVLEITDQSHPITQCVTHLLLTRASPAAESSVDDGVVARAVAWQAPPAGAGDRKPPRGSPAIWTRSAGKGRVVVIALEPAAVETDPERERAAVESRALDFLAARALEWAAGRQVTVRIPRGLPLLAERLGPLDAGTLPGFPATRGFHRGREIAPVMGYQAIDWLLRADREATELPEKVLDSLEIAEGSTAADVGAGAGYFTFRLARRVGPRGKVIATDVQREMIGALRERIAEEAVTNVVPVLATEDDPGLPPGEVDLVLMVDVYHELARPVEVLRSIARSLRPPVEGRRRARLVLVEYRGEDPSVPIKPLHRMTVDQARAEVEPAGFRWIETRDFLPHQHILVFEGR
jgi:ubiquinone/menaquinone biosynthesis C-methylase UbiE